MIFTWHRGYRDPVGGAPRTSINWLDIPIVDKYIFIELSDFRNVTLVVESHHELGTLVPLSSFLKIVVQTSRWEVNKD